MSTPVIAGAVRTPIGAFGGSLASVPATELGAIAIRESLLRAGVPGERVDDVLMGCILQAGLGQGPARQAAIRAGLPDTVPATTVNQLCGSGLRAVAPADLSTAATSRSSRGGEHRAAKAVRSCCGEPATERPAAGAASASAMAEHARRNALALRSPW